MADERHLRGGRLCSVDDAIVQHIRDADVRHQLRVGSVPMPVVARVHDGHELAMQHLRDADVHHWLRVERVHVRILAAMHAGRFAVRWQYG